MGRKGRGVLVWGKNTYSIKYRDPCKEDAYKQQGIGRITALPQLFCDAETFIAAIAEIYEGVTLEQADGFISLDFFEMDENGFLIVNQYEDYFILDSETGYLLNTKC